MSSSAQAERRRTVSARSRAGRSYAGPTGSRPVTRAGRRRLRRRRLAAFVRLAVFLLLIFLAVWAGVRVAHAGDAAAELGGRDYVVRDGDTLWSIAAAHYGSAFDLRQAVYEVRAASGLEGSDLQPGDRLTLPYLSD